MTTDNIFGNDILNGDLTTSLVPELGQENILIDVTPSETSLIDPLTQELSLTEPEIVIDEIDIDNNNASSFDSIPVANIDPLTAANPEEFQVNEIDVNDTSFAPPQSQLQFQGGFGDYDGGNDTTLKIKNTDGSVIETFKLSGEGQATLYRDQEYQYLFFSGVDETTKVEIDSTSNIKFGNYIGNSLKIETTGSIEGRDIILSEPDETGLILNSGIEGTATGNIYTNKYQITDLGGDFEYIYPTDINNLGQAVGYILADGTSKAFFYDDELGFQILDRYAHSSILGINDSGDVVGRFLNVKKSSTNIYDQRPFYTQEGEYIEPLAGKIPNSFDNLVDINNSGVVAGFGQIRKSYNGSRWNDSIIYDEGTRTRLFIDGQNIATAINDLGHVVGFSYETKQSFIYQDETVSWIEKSLEHTSNWARDINNSGQIVGAVSERIDTSAIHKVFIYSDGVMQIIDKNAGVAGIVKNNDHNQIVFSTAYTSSEGLKPYIYQNGELTNLNDLIDPEFRNAGWSLKSALEINNKGQIIGQASFRGENRGVILSPPPTPNYVKVGNISTFGDTVLLQGNEITLSGNAITTQGGEITFDGATTVNSNLTIDSSVIEDDVITDGGDITFTNTLDASSVGGQSLRVKAGTGNLLFSETVGGEATFFDFAVAGAGSVIINNDLAVDGNLNLEAINDINVANLSAAGLVNISLGKVGEEIYDSTGNVTTGNIEALGLEVLNNGNFTAGELTANDGDINIISLNQLTVEQLAATNGAIDLISGTAGINVSGAVDGNSGFVALAQQDIVTDEITSSQDAVILKSSQGAVTVNGSVTANDDVSLAAANDVSVGGIVVSSDEGAVSLFSGKETVTVTGTIVSADAVFIGAKKRVVAKGIKSKFDGIGLTSIRQSVVVRGELASYLGVEIAAKRNVVTRKITTQGDITLESKQGKARINGAMRTLGGDIYVSSVGDITARTIVSRGGDITLVTSQGGMKTGFIRSDRGNKGGQVHLQAYDTIRVAASRVINGTEYSIYTGVDNEEWIRINYQTGISDESQKLDFIIGDASTNGIKGSFIDKFVYATKFIPKKLVFSSSIIGTIVAELVLPQRTVPRHQDEINPITGQPYRDRNQFDFVNSLTDTQKDEIIDISNNSRYRLDLDYIEDEKEYGVPDEQGRRCIGIPLLFHLGGFERHNIYATHVTGSIGDYILVPPSPLPNNVGYVVYDGKVQAGSAATVPTAYFPTTSDALDILRREPVGSLSEVKTGFDFLVRINSGNPSEGVPDRGIPSDMARLNRLVAQINKEATLAKLCNQPYFLSFDKYRVAQAAGEEVISRLLPGLDVKVRYIKPPYTY